MPRMAALCVVALWCGVPAVAAGDNVLAQPTGGVLLADELWQTTDLLAGPGAESAAAQPTVLDERGERLVTRERGVRSAGAVPTASGNLGSWFRTTTALVAVVALILLLAWGYRAALGQRGLPLVARPRHPGLLEVVTRTTLTARQVLYLVRVGPRLVLIGASGEALRPLHAIEDADLCAQLLGQAVSGRTESETAAFQRWLEEAARNEAAPEEGAEPPVPDGQRLEGVRGQLQAALGRLRTRFGEA
ncbi:MAG: flagellar biosynthetic protein FliO [Phycisphaerales bacterium]|nr:flagellar biosynthetic protein FliO [Phycisphaerales bacterium]